MLKRDVEIDRVYRVRLRGVATTVRITGTVERQQWGSNRIRTHWFATNLATGRRIEIKSAAKLEPLIGTAV